MSNAFDISKVRESPKSTVIAPIAVIAQGEHMMRGNGDQTKIVPRAAHLPPSINKGRLRIVNGLSVNVELPVTDLDDLAGCCYDGECFSQLAVEDFSCKFIIPVSGYGTEAAKRLDNGINLEFLNS